MVYMVISLSWLDRIQTILYSIDKSKETPLCRLCHFQIYPGSSPKYLIRKADYMVL